jgi:hypothetical protein
MPRILIAAFKPKPNREAELLQVIADRLPLLRKLGLTTDRANITMRAADGTILDVSEWVDQAAIDCVAFRFSLRALRAFVVINTYFEPRRHKEHEGGRNWKSALSIRQFWPRTVAKNNH